MDSETQDAAHSSVGCTAHRVLGAMVAREPVEPMGWAVARREDGRPVYLVACVLGGENVESFERALGRLRGHLEPVDTFDEEGRLR